MSLYLFLLLVSLIVTGWAAWLPGAQHLGVFRRLTEIVFYLANLPWVIYGLFGDVVVAGAVLLVFCGVHLAHRALFSVIRRMRGAAE